VRLCVCVRACVCVCVCVRTYLPSVHSTMLLTRCGVCMCVCPPLAGYAYKVLSDTEKRQIYDMGGADALDQQVRKTCV